MLAVSRMYSYFPIVVGDTFTKNCYTLLIFLSFSSIFPHNFPDKIILSIKNSKLHSFYLRQLLSKNLECTQSKFESVPNKEKL